MITVTGHLILNIRFTLALFFSMGLTAGEKEKHVDTYTLQINYNFKLTVHESV